jgi:hypothetical protein
MLTDGPVFNVIAVCRAAALLACTEKLTVCVPDPLHGPPVTHPAPAEAVQAQPDCVVTVNDPPPPPAAKFCGDAETLYVQVGAAASCVMLTDAPVFSAIAVCRAAPPFACTEKLTVCVPEPLQGPPVTHAAPAVAVQAQPACVVTVSEPPPPLPAKFCGVADTL